MRVDGQSTSSSDKVNLAYYVSGILFLIIIVSSSILIKEELDHASMTVQSSELQYLNFSPQLRYYVLISRLVHPVICVITRVNCSTDTTIYCHKNCTVTAVIRNIVSFLCLVCSTRGTCNSIHK